MGTNVIDMPGSKVFNGSDQERVQKFLEGVERLSKQFDCVLVPEIRLTGTTIAPNIIVVARPQLSDTKPEGQA